MLRVPSQEWLDDDLGTPEEIQQSFDDLWRINRWLGGVSGCLHLLDRYFALSRVYRGRFVNRRNVEEARVIAAAVRHQLLQRPDESIGVVAMSGEQRDQKTARQSAPSGHRACWV